MLSKAVIFLMVSCVLAQEDQPPVPPPFKALGLLCGAPQIAPATCACANGGFFPNQIENLIACNPVECRCPGKQQWQKLKMFGCAEGGIPLCNNEEFGDIPWEKYECTDGSVIDEETIKESKLSGKCACKNGGKPVCKSNGQPALCPDRTPPSSDIGYVASFIKNCS